MSIDWNDDLTIGIREIDEQNKAIFSEFNQYCQSIEEGEGEASLKCLAFFLDEYQQNFAIEENLHLKSGCPGFEEHQADHRKFVSKIDKLMEQVQTQTPTREMIMATKGILIRWLIKHIKEKDKSLGNFLIAKAAESEKEFIGKDLGDILVEVNIISPITLERAKSRQVASGKDLGEVLEEMNVVSADEIRCALDSRDGKERITKKLGEILMALGVITHSTLDRAMSIQEQGGKPLGIILQQMGVASRLEVSEAQAIQKGFLCLNREARKSGE